MTFDFTFRASGLSPFPEGGHRIANCTPHDIHIIGNDESVVLTIGPRCDAARCEMEIELLGEFSLDLRGNGVHSPCSGTTIPVFGVEQTKGAVTHNLPPPKDGTLYIVSKIVAMANPRRKDLLMVWDTVRDDSGKVIGCRGLSIA